MKLSRKWWVSTITYALALIMLGACSSLVHTFMPDSRTVSGPLTQAASDGKAIKGDVHAASTQVGSSAQQIVNDGNDGKSRTAPTGPKPDGYLFTLFDRIVSNGSILLNQSGKLADIEARVQSLTDKVQAGATAFDQYKADTQKVMDGKDTTIAAQNKKIESLESVFMGWIHGLMLAVTLIFAANIGVCFMVKDFKIAVCVAIGCIVALVSLIVMGRVYDITFAHVDQIIWGLGITLGVCVLWFIVDVACRGSIAAAMKTSPVQDIEDLAAAVEKRLAVK